MSELVAKTSAAVAVNENLTTLIDWINIEAVADFTIIIENAGGGSADDITDVQIDTSDDGGITPSLDQHAGVPAVPIASGAAKTDTFTETAKFLRVRALCAAGEDTTAEAILLADTVVARICTLADVKDRLGLSNTDNDSVINRIVLGLEEVFNSEVNRPLIVNAADVTEYYTGCGSELQLLRYPIVSITSIKESTVYDFDSATALTENEAYRIVALGKNGILHRVFSDWPSTVDGIQVINRGGFCAAGQSPGTGEFALPADLREAAIEQSSFLFKRKDDLGLSGISSQGGSISKFSSINFLPMVKRILDKYRRPSL